MTHVLTIFPIAGALGLLAQTAIACPTAADLTTGVRTVEADDTVTVYSTHAPGVVNAYIDWGDGGTANNLLAQGVYVHRLTTATDGVLDIDSVMEVTYPDGIDALQPPTPGLRQRIETTVTTVDDVVTEVQDQSWGPLASITIGACEYDSITGQITYTADGDSFIETIVFLPQVGLGLLTEYRVSADDVDVFVITEIAAVE